MCFYDTKEFIGGVEAGKVIAVASVEKASLPDEDVKEPEKRTERKPLREKLEPATHADAIVTQTGGAVFQPPINRHARLPVGVTIMLLHKDIDRGKRIMIHLAAQPRSRSLHDDMLVHFVVAAVRFRLG